MSDDGDTREPFWKSQVSGTNLDDYLEPADEWEVGPNANGAAVTTRTFHRRPAPEAPPPLPIQPATLHGAPGPRPGRPSLNEDDCRREAEAARKSLEARGIHHPMNKEWIAELGLSEKQFRLRKHRWPHLYR